VQFAQALLKFAAKRFDQTLLKFDGANPLGGWQKEKGINKNGKNGTETKRR
jgi:hypothetical protein